MPEIPVETRLIVENSSLLATIGTFRRIKLYDLGITIKRITQSGRDDYYYLWDEIEKIEVNYRIETLNIIAHTHILFFRISFYDPNKKNISFENQIFNYPINLSKKKILKFLGVLRMLAERYSIEFPTAYA